MRGGCPASTSLLDGFGDSCDLGANSMGIRWALRGRELQRAASKSRSSWQSSERPVRREGGSRAARPSSYPRRLKLELTRSLLEINREFHWSLERSNPFLTPSGIPVDITKVGVNRDLGLKSPISRGVRLVAIKIFFCVCLAHARQWGIRHPHCHRRGLYCE